MNKRGAVPKSCEYDLWDSPLLLHSEEMSKEDTDVSACMALFQSRDIHIIYIDMPEASRCIIDNLDVA